MIVQTHTSMQALGHLWNTHTHVRARAHAHTHARTHTPCNSNWPIDRSKNEAMRNQPKELLASRRTASSLHLFLVQFKTQRRFNGEHISSIQISCFQTNRHTTVFKTTAQINSTCAQLKENRNWDGLNLRLFEFFTSDVDRHTTLWSLVWELESTGIPIMPDPCTEVKSLAQSVHALAVNLGPLVGKGWSINPSRQALLMRREEIQTPETTRAGADDRSIKQCRIIVSSPSNTIVPKGQHEALRRAHKQEKLLVVIMGCETGRATTDGSSWLAVRNQHTHKQKKRSSERIDPWR